MKIINRKLSIYLQIFINHNTFSTSVWHYFAFAGHYISPEKWKSLLKPQRDGSRKICEKRNKIVKHLKTPDLFNKTGMQSNQKQISFRVKITPLLVLSCIQHCVQSILSICDLLLESLSHSIVGGFLQHGLHVLDGSAVTGYIVKDVNGTVPTTH